jgi:hypothetical protein
MPRLQIPAGSLQPGGCEHEFGAVRSQVGDAVSQGLALVGQTAAQGSDRAEALRQAGLRDARGLRRSLLVGDRLILVPTGVHLYL